MNMINLNSIITKLNDECQNKNKEYSNKWTLLDVEKGYHRTYCYNAYTVYNLCSYCEETLRELEIEQNGLSSYVNQIDELKTKVYDLECTVAELQHKFGQYEKNIK